MTQGSTSAKHETSASRAPIKLASGALACLAAVAGVIANIDKVREFAEASVEGEWVLTNTIEESAFAPYRGLSVTYRLFLTDRAGQLTGTGEKIMENGKEIAISARSPIEVIGGVDGSQVTARFVLKPAPDGAARETRGQFEWEVVSEQLIGGRALRLEGTFAATGASSRGRSVATRPGS